MAWSIIVAFAVQDLLQFSGEWFFHLSFVIFHLSFGHSVSKKPLSSQHTLVRCMR